MASSDNPTVIFILGLPFSGSTLAAAALGSSENVFNCGEVSYVEKDWKPRRPCSCGQQLDLCPHWTAIRAEMRANSAQGLPGLHATAVLAAGGASFLASAASAKRIHGTMSHRFRFMSGSYAQSRRRGRTPLR